jgi:hypothetical protein
MNQTFNFQSSIKNVQNNIISQNIRDVSNMELLRSEEAIDAVISSYMDRFNAIGGMLFNVGKYIAKSKTVVRSDDLNDMFENLYIDLASLYSDLELVDKVLSLNLQRNKNYFLIIKKRIRDLWNKLNLTRSFIHDASPSDESYYESFYTDISANLTRNIWIDKKSGFMYLNPLEVDIQNKSYLIKSVSSTTYPEQSDRSNIIHTTNTLNTFEDNYSNSGPKDMLANGLWKEEVLSPEIPLMIVNIGSSDVPINRNYRGIVSLVDINYNYPNEINRLDIDTYGDKAVTIDAVLYKENDSDEWKVAEFVAQDPLLTTNPSTWDVTNYSVRGRSFDLLMFNNITKIKVKQLRIVFNQEEYTFLDSASNKESSVDSKIQNDLGDRRYELIKFGSSLDENLATPINDSNTSLYNKIVTLIEETRNIEEILQEIEKVILPPVNIVEYSFENTVKFEVGSWSIEPKRERYVTKEAAFDSVGYKLNDKALISASLITSQQTPGPTTCNWYINVKNKDVPIVENNYHIRKEPIYKIDLSSYSNFSDWGPGTFILLDLPIDPYLADTIGIYTNGTYNEEIYSKISFLNSRLLYMHDITDSERANFVLRYSCALNNSVILYSLAIKPSSQESSFNKISFGIVSARKEALQSFIENVGYSGNTSRLLKEDFVVVSSLATKSEAATWFGTDFARCIFIADEIISLIDVTSTNNYDNFSNTINLGQSKVGSTIIDANNHYAGGTGGYADLGILSAYANIAPLNITRNL